MLRLVLGRAGTGKTTTLYNQLAQAVNEGKPAILLVPEQFSFEAERTLYRKLGISNMRHVEVLSFTRLSEAIFRSLGGLAGHRLDDTARRLLMRLALQQLGDTLQLYRRHSRKTAFVTALVDAVTQWKLAGAYPDELLQASGLQSGQLAAKLKELALIYSAYQALVEQGFSDPSDDITRAGKLAAGGNWFAGRRLFVDGFAYFSQPERQLLRTAIEQAEEVWVALCCPGGQETPEEQGIFSTARQTAGRLIADARRAAVPVAIPVVLEQHHRFSSPALARLENLLSGNPVEQAPLPPADDTLTITAAGDAYAEASYAAATVCRLVRQGLRYRDMVVIVRKLEDYQTPIETVFGAYGIPYFADRRVSVESQPLALALLGGLETATQGFSTESLLRLAKCPAQGLETQAVALLENYCYTWSIDGKAWRQPFTLHPDGAQAQGTPQSQARLEALNQTRSRLLAPLEAFAQRLEGCDGLGFATACYEYLEDIAAPANIRSFAAQMPPLEQKNLLELTEALWEQLMNILDLFATLLAERSLPPAELAELLRSCIRSIDLGQIPRTGDELLCGSADRIRPFGCKVAIVMGVNEGVFPAELASGGLFSEAELGRLALSGLELSQPPYQRALAERNYLYTALTTPSHQLYITYATAQLTGAPLLPAQALERLATGLGCAVTQAESLPELAHVVNQTTALARLAAGRDPLLAATLREYFARSQAGELARLETAADPLPKPIEAETAKRLLGGQLLLSPSRLERYFACPFQFFCADMLRLRPLRRVEFSPLESGSVVHLVLEQLLQRHGAELARLPERQLAAEAAEIINTYLLQLTGQQQEALSPRQLYLFRRLVQVLVKLLQRLGAEFLHSRFVPTGFEVQVGPQAEVKPLRLPTAYGEVVLQGRIDRVDTCSIEGQTFLRVVDYKSGGKKLSLPELYAGLNTQLLFYLFSLCEGESGRFTGNLPAGVLYMPAYTQSPVLPRRANSAELAAAQEKGLRQNGLLLDDITVLEAMEEGLGGRFIPVNATGSGVDKRSPLASPAQLQDIRRYLTRLVEQMAEQLYHGQIAPLPAIGSESKPCQFCEYTGLCQNANASRCRTIAQIDKEAFFTAIAGGE